MMTAVLDVVLIAILLVRASVGWHTGFARGIAQVLGVLAGGLLGLFIAGRTWGSVSRWLAVEQVGTSSLLQVLYVVVITLVLVGVGEAVGLRIVRSITRGRHPGRLDRGVGALAAVVATSVLIWVVALSLRPVLPAPWSGTIAQSRVVGTIDRVVPDRFESVPRELTAPLRSLWPRVFPGLGVEPSIAAPAPDTGVDQTPAIQRAGASVLKIATDAPQCRADSVGSGWVVAPGRVVTNAHVVAGSSEVTVQVGGTGLSRAATVVAFDPDLDLAILAVEGLTAPALPRATGAAGESVAALGFPGGGPYTVSPSRVRGTIPIVGPDVFGGPGEARQVHTVRGEIHPGNSGGPLVNEQGQVVGTVFAASTVDPETYFALTESDTKAILDQASQLTRPVSTQGCTVG